MHDAVHQKQVIQCHNLQQMIIIACIFAVGTCLESSAHSTDYEYDIDWSGMAMYTHYLAQLNTHRSP